MEVIGITGSSGSGKTTISKIIAKDRNIKIIDADKVAKDLTMENTEYLQRIIKIFGEDIAPENELDRQKLAKIIYNDNEAREKLNELTFKYVVGEIKTELNKAKQEQFDAIILDVPLLFESNLNKECDVIIGVIAPKKEKIERICYRDKITKEDAIKRLKTQKNDEYLKQNCNFIIENISYGNTIKRVEKILKKLQ